MSIDRNEPPKEIWERRKLGLELRQKYELYFVSLTFTLAAASIQSASHAGQRWRLVIEIAGWVLLSVAGLVGIWRIGKLWLREVGTAELQGMGSDALTKRGESLGNDLDGLEKRIRRYGAFQYWTFIVGFAAVGISRAALLICP